MTDANDPTGRAWLIAKAVADGETLEGALALAREVEAFVAGAAPPKALPAPPPKQPNQETTPRPARRPEPQPAAPVASQPDGQPALRTTSGGGSRGPNPKEAGLGERERDVLGAIRELVASGTRAKGAAVVKHLAERGVDLTETYVSTIVMVLRRRGLVRTEGRTMAAQWVPDGLPAVVVTALGLKNERATRPCLRCGKAFNSIHKGNRICPTCAPGVNAASGGLEPVGVGA